MNSRCSSSIRGFGSLGFLIMLGVVLATFAVVITTQPWKGKTPSEVTVIRPFSDTATPPSPPHIRQPSDTTATSSIDTSDWKTYRNEEYKFEVKYPTSLYINRPLLSKKN